MNYIGSKLKLINFIREEITETIECELKDIVFCDLFAGSGIVGREFKRDVKQVISNDLEFYSYILNRHYIGNVYKAKDIDKKIEELNNVEIIESGFIYQNYCLGSGSGRLYFSDQNGKKIDSIRIKIEEWKVEGKINDNEYYLLLTSLLESADKVANTASVYASFLKKLKRTAEKEMVLSIAKHHCSERSNQVFNEDANDLIKKIEGDVLYLDPPYNHRQYGSYYHILNTIAEYEEFVPQGITGMRDYNRSNFCKKKGVIKSFEDIIKSAKFKFIFLSYNNEGLMSESEVSDILRKYGELKVVKKEYQRFKSDKTESREHKADKTYEYLYILKKPQ